MTDNFQIVLNEIDSLLNDYIDRVFELSQVNLVEDGKSDTGMLLKTANINRGYLQKTIVYPMEYAEYVEYGRHPGSFPPIEPIQKWCMRKLGMEEKEANKTAWAIAKAIEQRGIAPSQFLQRAIEQANNEFGV